MIVSLFIVSMIIGLILFLVAYDRESVVLTSASLFFWIFNYASSLGIGIQYVTGGVLTTDTIQEYGVQIMCLGMVFINIAMLIVFIVNYKNTSKF